MSQRHWELESEVVWQLFLIKISSRRWNISESHYVTVTWTNPFTSVNRVHFYAIFKYSTRLLFISFFFFLALTLNNLIPNPRRKALGHPRNPVPWGFSHTRCNRDSWCAIADWSTVGARGVQVAEPWAKNVHGWFPKKLWNHTWNLNLFPSPDTFSSKLTLGFYQSKSNFPLNICETRFS